MSAQNPNPAVNPWLSLSRVLMLAIPLAILGFLYNAEFFNSYHGEVVGWRPLPRSDGADDALARYVLSQGEEHREEVLPTAPFQAWQIPLTRGVYPGHPPIESPPVAHKDPASFHLTVADAEVSTMHPVDFLLPLLFVVVAVLARNVFVTGHPFEVEPTPGRGKLPGIYRPPPDSKAEAGPPAARPKKGPPPQGKKGKGKGRRKRRKR